MGSTVGRRTGFWRRFESEVEDMGLAVAGAAEAMRRTIAEGRNSDRVELIEITAKPEDQVVNSNADVLCIDLRKYGIAAALDWIQRRQKYAVQEYGAPASIAVLANSHELSLDDLRRISWDIEPAGARFHPWPDDCHSFAEAFELLAEDIKNNYRWPTMVAR